MSLSTQFPIITLGGTEVELKPTLGATVAINKAFGGLNNAHQRLFSNDFEGYVLVVQHARGVKDAKAVEKLREQVYGAGMIELLVPLTQYIAILMNGGKPLNADEGTDTDADVEGNENPA